jgi:hypothetical protein
MHTIVLIIPRFLGTGEDHNFLVSAMKVQHLDRRQVAPAQVH